MLMVFLFEVPRKKRHAATGECETNKEKKNYDFHDVRLWEREKVVANTTSIELVGMSTAASQGLINPAHARDTAQRL